VPVTAASLSFSYAEILLRGQRSDLISFSVCLSVPAYITQERNIAKSFDFGRNTSSRPSTDTFVINRLIIAVMLLIGMATLSAGLYSRPFSYCLYLHVLCKYETRLPSDTSCQNFPRTLRAQMGEVATDCTFGAQSEVLRENAGSFLQGGGYNAFRIVDSCAKYFIALVPESDEVVRQYLHMVPDLGWGQRVRGRGVPPI